MTVWRAGCHLQILQVWSAGCVLVLVTVHIKGRNRWKSTIRRTDGIQFVPVLERQPQGFDHSSCSSGANRGHGHSGLASLQCFQPLFYPCACEQPISLLQLEQYCLWGVQTAWGASGGKPCSRRMRRVSVLSPAKHAKS